MFETSLSMLDWDALTTSKTFFPSPADWEDEVIYSPAQVKSPGATRATCSSVVRSRAHLMYG